MRKSEKSDNDSRNNLRQRTSAPSKSDLPDVHVYNKHVVCVTDSRGYATHRNLSPFEIRVDASNGFIPLWAEGVTLRYRFRQRSIRQYFEDPEAAQAAILRLFGEALDAWGDAAPVRFKYDEDVSDFEFDMIQAPDCDSSGCVLASAFFPDEGRHLFRMYPTMLEQGHKEQVDTFIHEIGHIFGLRHFFANISEAQWPSRLFGEDRAFSIMNYGHMSELTETDTSDLARLYRLAWSGKLTEIDRAPIRLFHPYSGRIDMHRPHSLAAREIERVNPKPTHCPIEIAVAGRSVVIR